MRKHPKSAPFCLIWRHHSHLFNAAAAPTQEREAQKKTQPVNWLGLSGSNLSSQCLGGEAAAAAAGAGRVGILEDEPAAHDLVLEVDLGAVQVEIALHVAQDLHAVRLH